MNVGVVLEFIQMRPFNSTYPSCIKSRGSYAMVPAPVQFQTIMLCSPCNK